MTYPDHRDSVGSVHDLLVAHNIPGIEGIDTRSLTRRVREHGTLLCVFGPAERLEEMEVILEELTPPDADDLVAEVTCDKPTLLNPGAEDGEGNILPRLAAIDCGVKHNILRELCTRFEVVWCPADMPLEEITRDWSPDALFASNGPGDPAHPGAATDARRTLAAAVRQGMPVMGICLGHQLMGLAAGLRTYKLRYGHRGSNQPVMDLETGRVHITSQNHGFAVEDPVQGMLAPHPSGACSETSENVLGAEFRVRHVNSNDGTVEGLDLLDKPAFTIQFHPEACPGPHDASPLFDRFQKIVAEHLASPEAELVSKEGGS
jgi:carbamoyl-phosphate synthase small subunit